MGVNPNKYSNGDIIDQSLFMKMGSTPPPQMLGKWAENLEKYMRSCDTCDNNDSSHIRSNINLFKKNWFNSGFHKGDTFSFSWLTKSKGTKDDDKIRCTVNGQV